ncbi:hypothetical protein ABPG72_007926 [Tetrahymena utriculariae]
MEKISQKESSQVEKKETIENIPSMISQTQQCENQGEGIKELLLSGSAGALTYQMGYLYKLTEFVGKEKLREYKIGAISAGTAIGVYFHTTLYTDLDLKHFYLNRIRKFFEKENRKYYGFFTSGALIEKYCYEQWDLMEEQKFPHVNGIFHCYVSQVEGLFSLKKKLIDNFEDKYDFTEALISSAMIPILTRPKIFNEYKGKKCLDGGLTQVIPYKYQESKKIFINALPKYTREWPVVREEIKNIEYFDIMENSNVWFPRDYWIWDENFSDEMFVKGQFAAENDKERLIKVFL